MVLRGLEQRHEQDPTRLLRDTRTIGQRVYDFFQDPRNGAIVLCVLALFAFIFAAVADIIFLVAIFIFLYSFGRRTKLPFRMPMASHVLDYNDLKPGGSKPNMARGICFYGNDHMTNEELWFNNDDMRTHTLIFGSTGSGKTEALISLAYNALLQGSGFIYVDGKGDNTLFAKVFSMARSLGREDDVLVINFMTGARDIVGPQKNRISNTMNPFANGSSSMLTQLVVSLMSSSSNSGDGDMWKGRAIAFVEAIMKPLVYMRDEGKLLLDANAVRNYFILDRLESMVIDKVFPRDNDEPVSLAEVPSTIMEPLYNYVINLPGYDKSKKGKQVSQVLEQHGFITMQLTRVFTSLADTYGHILRTNLAEVDLKDVVLNRRILAVLLPALEKSPDELSNLGKVIIASLKAMMASGLGDEVEGEYHDVVMRKPTNSPTPYMCILDEYGYYAVEGFAVVPAQARSLGFSVIFAGQDLPAFQKASKEEAASIGANTNIKIAMKLEDPVETWDFFAKTAGEAYVTKVDSFQTNSQSITNNYLDAKSASYEKRARIDLLDLKDQREGEAHIFFKSRIVRAKLFYANPEPVNKMRLNHFLKVEPPTSRLLGEFEDRLSKWEELLQSGDFDITDVDSDEQLDHVVTKFRDETIPTLIEKGVSALMALQEGEDEEPFEEDEDNEDLSFLESSEEEGLSFEDTEDELSSQVDIFTKTHYPELTHEFVSDEDFKTFSEVFLAKSRLYKNIEYAEKVFGNSTQEAKRIAEELVREMEYGTKYPPNVEQEGDPDEIAGLIDELCDSIASGNNDSEE